MSDEKRLPFRLLDEGLDAVKRVTGAVSAAALGAVRSTGRPEGAERSEAKRAANATTDPLTEAAPSPDQTATAPGALATALDEKASAALADAVGEGRKVTDGLAIEEAGGRVAPDEELGPKPFEPQVGP